MDNISRSLLNHCNVDFESETLSTPENSTPEKPANAQKIGISKTVYFSSKPMLNVRKQSHVHTLYSFCHLFIVQVPKRNRWLKCALQNLLINCPQRKFALNQHVHIACLKCNKHISMLIIFDTSSTNYVDISETLTVAELKGPQVEKTGGSLTKEQRQSLGKKRVWASQRFLLIVVGSFNTYIVWRGWPSIWRLR